jgi:hypothetical protein
MTYTNRIVAYGSEPVDSILFHPDNWRIHPVRQQDAVKGSLSSIGWVEPVLINMRTGQGWPEDERGKATLVNGHMRVKLAMDAGEMQVPVIYVDLDPEEETFILASLDPLAALANTDNAKLLKLTAEIPAQNETIRAALRGAGVDVRENFLHIATAEGGKENSDVPPPRQDQQERDPRQHDRQVHQPQTVSTPADRERYPLAIVLSRRDYNRWLAWKERCDENSDTAAFVALLDTFVDGEIDDRN